MSEILRKTLELQDFKFDTEQGIFEGYASIFNKVDSYNEVVMPGAFKKHLKFFKKEGKILWQHNSDWPIGLPLKVKEDEKGLFIKAQITKNTQVGAETIALIKEKIVNKLSFGYKLIKYEDDTETGIRKLLEIKVYDISPVTFPAMSFAEIQTIKAIRNGKEFKLIEKEKDKVEEVEVVEDVISEEEKKEKVEVEVISEEEKREKEVIRFTQNIVSIENYLKMLVKDERDLSEVQDKLLGLVELLPKQTDEEEVITEDKKEITPELIVQLVKEKVEESMKEILK